MKEKLIWISDYFVHEINGGAELCDAAWIEFLEEKYEIKKIKSIDFIKNISFDKNCKYIFSNFAQLGDRIAFEKVVSTLVNEEINYWILEHDSKYCMSRNPFLHGNGMICNCFTRDSHVHMFYMFSKAVFCQTSFHKNIFDQNVYCNTINLGTNLWRKDEIAFLKFLKNKELTKNNKFLIFNSQQYHKNTKGAIELAEKHGFEYELISGLNWKDYTTKLSESKGIIFVPKLAESASRLVFEAKFLGKKVYTNKLVGYAWEDWWKDETFDADSLFETAKLRFLNELDEAIPKISIFSTTYNAERFIKGFLENVSSFNFDSYEVVIYDGCSTDTTEKTIKDFIDVNNLSEKIRLFRSRTHVSAYVGWNRALSRCRAPLVVNMNADDRFSTVALSKLHETIVRENADFIYSDSLMTSLPNETFEKNTAKGRRFNWPEYNHEKLKANCYGGHFPLWRKKLLLKSGLFDESLISAADWDQWIKFSRDGAKFKKLNEILGLYYMNPNGVSTNPVGGMSWANAEESAKVRSRYD